LADLTRNANVSVGTASVELAFARPNRKLWYVRNTGATTITVAIDGNAAVANAGFVLAPTDVVSESKDFGFVPYAGVITAVGSAAGGTIAVVETVEA